MTVGGGGGSPKTIQTIDLSLAVGNYTNLDIYPCPADTYAIINPQWLFHSFFGPGPVNLTNLSIKIVNPVTAALTFENLNYPFQGAPGIAESALIVPALVINAGLLAVNPGRFVDALYLNANPPSAYGNHFIVMPGETLVGSFQVSGTAAKFRYGLQEFGIAT